MKVSTKLKSYEDFKKDYKPVNEFFNFGSTEIIKKQCDVCGCMGVNCTCTDTETVDTNSMIADEITKLENGMETGEVEKAITITFSDVNNSTSDFMPKIFSIVKLMTQNGEKVAMCYSEDVSNYGTPIHQNLDFKTACDMVKNHCLETGCEEFKTESDNIIGQIPSFMIQKKTDSNTSYKK